MKRWSTFLLLIVVGWPSVVFGYVRAAWRSGLEVGEISYERHEDAFFRSIGWAPRR